MSHAAKWKQHSPLLNKQNTMGSDRIKQTKHFEDELGIAKKKKHNRETVQWVCEWVIAINFAKRHTHKYGVIRSLDVTGEPTQRRIS